MTNKIFHTFLLALLCTTQISTNAFSMDPTSLYELRRTGNERLELLPEIQGKIVTTILDLYLSELEETIQKFNEDGCPLIEPVNIFHNCFLYKKHDTHSSLYKILYWIHCTRFKPLQEHINLDTKSSHGNTILHHTTRASLDDLHDTPILSLKYTDSGDLYISEPDQGHDATDMFNLTRYLLEHKANPNTHNNLGKSPFVMWTKFFSMGLARRPVEDELIHLFLDNKADPNVASKDNSFIFTLATGYYSQAIERILKNTDLKAIMNNKNESGDTLAIHAVEWNNLEFLQILADAGADFDITDSEGRTPLNLALNFYSSLVAERFEKMITLLKSKTTNK